MSEPKPDRNRELMYAAGSTNGAYDVEAPDQWKWSLRHSKCETEKAMAWVKSTSVAWPHNSPFCIDEHGNPLYIKHIATALGWKEKRARNALMELARQGRIRLEGSIHAKEAKRIWYCADIPQAGEKGEQKGKQNSSVQTLPPHLVDLIAKLPTEKARQAATDDLTKCAKWNRDLLADVMAAARSMANQNEDTLLRRHGIPDRRLPKRREPKTEGVQLTLLAQPEFLQTPEPPPPALPSSSATRGEVLRALVERGVQEGRARKLLKDLPAEQPAMDQIEWGDMQVKLKERTRDPIQNPPGFYVHLLTCNYPVPASFETSHKRALHEQAQQRDMESRAREAQLELDAYEGRERYEASVAAKADEHIESQPQPAIERRIKAHMAKIQGDAPQYRWPPDTLRGFALKKLREEIAIELGLPTFEEFRAGAPMKRAKQ